MQVQARPARPEDGPAVAQLLADSVATIESERGGALFALREGVLALADPELHPAPADPQVLTAVGLLDDVVLGVAIGRIEVLRDGSVLARLEHLWVDPQARQVGLGEEMLRLVLSWAAERGAGHLDAHALPGDRDSKNFLESSGFAARLIVMSRSLQ